MRYTESPHFTRILKRWDSSIGKETYFTEERYKESPNCFSLYNINAPGGIKETDEIINLYIRCPHCRAIHLCHLPDQSPEVEHLAHTYTTCTKCDNIFHLLSHLIRQADTEPQPGETHFRFLTEEEIQHNKHRAALRERRRQQQTNAPTAHPEKTPHHTPNNKLKIDLTLALTTIIIVTASFLISEQHIGEPFGNDHIADITRIISALYLGSNVLYFFGLIIASNFYYYEAPKSWTVRTMLSAACLFWFSPVIIYHTIKYLNELFRKPTVRQHIHPFPLIICALLIIATFDLPQGYYQFMRIAVTAWGTISLIQTNLQLGKSNSKTYSTILSGAITILYNPILPIHLDKDHWLAINLISVPAVLICTYLTNRHKTDSTTTG